MTQHIRILAPDKVEPHVAHVWRDDQTVMWGLAPGLAWPPDNPLPIRFLGPDGKYVEWPGTTPAPIGPKPDVGPDQRYYVALGNFVNMSPEVIWYHYEIDVQDLATGEVVHVKVRHRDDPDGWYDPDVGNEPQP
jgi:hypothetical protein